MPQAYTLTLTTNRCGKFTTKQLLFSQQASSVSQRARTNITGGTKAEEALPR